MGSSAAGSIQRHRVHIDAYEPLKPYNKRTPFVSVQQGELMNHPLKLLLRFASAGLIVFVCVRIFSLKALPPFLSLFYDARRALITDPKHKPLRTLDAFNRFTVMFHRVPLFGHPPTLRLNKLEFVCIGSPNTVYCRYSCTGLGCTPLFGFGRLGSPPVKYSYTTRWRVPSSRVAELLI